MLIKPKSGAPPVQLRFGACKFGHEFGGPATHEGAIPFPNSVAMHRMLTLDLADEAVPIYAENCQLSFLPLYYPLRFGFGGGEAQYRIVSEHRIEVLHIGANSHDEESYPHMDMFPRRTFQLQTIPYKHFRALLMSEQGRSFTPSTEDRKLLRELDASRLSFLGDGLLTLGGDTAWQCKNKTCPWSDQYASLHIFARIAGSPCAGLEIFGQHGSDVQIYFGLCQMCGTIVTFNRCT